MNTNNIDTNETKTAEAYDLIYLNDESQPVHAQVLATSREEAIKIFHQTNPTYVTSCDSVANSKRLLDEAAAFLAKQPKSDLQTA